ncbi:MAG: ATP-binding cassette domain-containing protein [Oligoflexia bacterium]|nr:ATP-binding cassette domain-containing protein [Oligoflexia bacterium]
MAQNLLQLKEGKKSFGSKLLFDNATCSINLGEHVGLIGPNGAGKTTFFRVILGEENLDSGEIIQSRDLRIGYLSQHDEWMPDETVESFLTRFSRIPLWELKSIGRSLYLFEEVYTSKITDLSGGYRMRVKLLGLLGQEPNLMLLDEPTNYLDLETTLVLEEFLQNFKYSFILISHDREFLRKTTDHILEIEEGEFTKYPGNLDDYFEQKELLRQQLESKAMSVSNKRKEILDFVARFGAKATKARQAQSRLKQLEKLEDVNIKPIPRTSAIRIPEPEKTGKVVVQFKDVQLGYNSKIILRNLNLEILRSDHVAVVGFNGAGKSTFLKAIAGSLSPQKGTIEFGMGVQFGYYSQHVVEQVGTIGTIYEALEASADVSITRQQILDLAGALLFSGDDLYKPLKILSGGEKARVAIGQILLRKKPVLVLDEPTNHLDFQTVETLVNALSLYEGTVIVVSHDRSFIKRVGRKILEVDNGNISLYMGNYEEYLWSVSKRIIENQSLTNIDSVSKQNEQERKWNWKEEKKKIDREIRILEKKITEAQELLISLEERREQLNSEIASTQEGNNSLLSEMIQIDSKIVATEASWAEAENKLLELNLRLKDFTL